MNLELLTIGDELLLGFTVDTNGAYLARALAAVGIVVVRRTAVGDTADAIAGAVRESLDRTGAVITTGGLGPTADDLTKPAIARLFGRGLTLHEPTADAMRERWRKRFGRAMPDSNLRQAMLPDGARILVNRHGSAPGVFLEDERGRWVAMLPGVPRELRGMTDDELIPFLSARGGTGGRVVRSRTVRTTGIAESALADLLGRDLGEGVAGASLAYLPSPDGTDLRLTTEGESGDVDARLAEGAAKIAERVGRHAYGEGDADIAASVLELCRARGFRVAVAESCTGGMLGQRLTAIAGSSDVMTGGVIAYDNSVKGRFLGVPREMLATHGAVSEQVARHMASAARTAFDANIGFGITGVAGPGGGTPEKPVGTVWIALDLEGDNRAQKLVLIGDRAEIRYRATQAALDMLRRALLA
jgi:nicotinamide-nucleotide amidase